MFARTLPPPLPGSATWRFHSERPALRGGVTSHLGWHRAQNEDFCAVSADGALVVLADGVGGHEAGDVAARIAVRTILALLDGYEGQDHGFALRRAIEVADARIHNLGDAPGRRGMGATIVVAWFHGRHCTIAHAGDSRGYRLRGSRLEPLTVDHSPAGDLVRRGVISETDYRFWPKQREVTQCLGGGLPGVAVELLEVEVQPGDRVLLCSDGLSDLVRDFKMGQLLDQHRDPLSAAEGLEREALAAGGTDNVTIAVVEVL